MALASAVVGAGTVSEVHLSGLDSCPRTDLVAVCDIDEGLARDAAREYGVTPYFDLETMLEAESLDWVHVCTSVQSHLPLARTVLEAGVPVLVEKPVTRNREEYERLVAASEDASVPFSVVHNHLYDPVMRVARDRIAGGDVGPIRGVDLVYSGLTSPDARHRGSWVFDLGGGEFTEGLPHPLYAAVDLAGRPASPDAVSVQTSLSREYEQGFAYDSAQVQYRSADGALCSVMMLSGNVPQRLLQVHCEHQTLVIDRISQTLSTLSRDYTGSKVGAVLNTADRVTGQAVGTVKNAVAVARSTIGDGWETRRNLTPHYYQFEVEARALQRGEHPDPAVEERARWTITLLDAIEATATSGGATGPSPVEEAVDGTATVDD